MRTGLQQRQGIKAAHSTKQNAGFAARVSVDAENLLCCQLFGLAFLTHEFELTLGLLVGL